MNWVPVRSSNLAAVAYEVTPTPPYRRMYVRFKSGAVYYYDDVERPIYEALLLAPSAGQFLNTVVRANGTDSRYAYGKT